MQLLIKKKPITKQIQVVFLLPLIFMACLVAGAHKAGAAGEEVISTEIDIDEGVISKSAGNVVVPSKTATVAGQADAMPPDKQMVLMNASLKNAIEENRKISEENRAMAAELKQLRGVSEVNANRINFLNNQRDDLQKKITETEVLNKQYTEQLERLKSDMAEKEKEFEKRLSDVEREQESKKEEDEKTLAEVLPQLKSGRAAVSNEEMASLKRQAQATIENFEKASSKVRSRISQLQVENKKLKVDSAKLHYNLANTFFEQGRYKQAAAEYKKVVEALPNDAEAHYNLAFVCGEFLNDYPTAIKHYEQYLYLNPQAEDVPLVNEKILELKLYLKTKIDSPIDRIPTTRMDMIDVVPGRK